MRAEPGGRVWVVWAALADVVVSVEGASTAVEYFQLDGSLAPSDTGTALEVGEAFVWDLEPGLHTVNFELEGATCRLETDPAGPDNRSRVRIAADVLTMITIACQ